MTQVHQPLLQDFLAATLSAIAARTVGHAPARRAMARVSAALAKSAEPRSPVEPCALPVCAHLPAALNALAGETADLAHLADTVRRIAPHLCWRQRVSADAQFMAGHANADVVGPATDALERRGDVRIGLSLMAPATTYPDHQHPPEEVYIVLSSGEWRQDADAWVAPGVGGIVYNPPNIVHAMRASSTPLLAIWCLPS